MEGRRRGEAVRAVTADEARTAVDVIGHTLVAIADQRTLCRSAMSLHEGIEAGLVAIGLEVERIVQAGHAAELAGLGAAVERWRR